MKGHGPGQEQLVWGKRKVKIAKLEPVGTYAVRIVFDDGHNTGLYTWSYLLKLGREHGSDLASLSRQADGRRIHPAASG